MRNRRANPNRKIFLLMTTKTRMESIPSYMAQFENVYFRKLDINEVTRDTQAQRLWESGQVAASRYVRAKNRKSAISRSIFSSS